MDIVEIQQCFDRAAAAYAAHDALEREVGQRLLQRLEFARQPVERAFDLGCGPGHGAAALKARYPGASVVALDLSKAMLGLRQAHAKGAVAAVQADLARLPFAARSADLVFCNLAIQWASDFARALAEFRRVLKPGGMLLFSVPGPGSLMELRRSAGPGVSTSLPIYMPDLRDVGDLLVSTGFSEPVMDSEHITLRYLSGEALVRELAATGAAGFLEIPLPEARNGGPEITFEIVYGTAFGAPEGRPVRSGDGEVATFSVDQIRTRSRK